MRNKTIVITPANVSTTAIAAAQTLAGAGNFVLVGGSWASTSTMTETDANGAHTVGLVAQQVTFTSTADISAVNLTVTGTDENGVAITETRVGPNNSTVSTTKYFATVSQVAADAAVGTNTSVGFGAVGITSPVLASRVCRTTGLAVVVSGTANYSVQICPQDLSTGAITTVLTYVDATDSNLVSQTASKIGSCTFPICGGYRVKLNSYSNGAVITFIMCAPDDTLAA